MSVEILGRDIVILACAISAGIHGALVPAHLAEGPGAGAGFVAATVALAAVATGLTRHPASAVPLGAAALVFAGLIGSYALAVTTRVPILHPEPEPVAGLALAAKAAETVGLVAGSVLVRRRLGSALPQPKGVLAWTRDADTGRSRSF